MLRDFLIVLGALAFAGVAGAQRPDPSPPATAAQRDEAWRRHRELEDASLFAHLPWRSVGPVVQGGRVVDIEVDPRDSHVFYVAYASGGLWKTTTNGSSFAPLFDREQTIIMGDVAIDPSHPETVWVGTGESNSSRSSYGGAGVYRSSDGGASWDHVGLAGTDRIGRVLVDPRDGRRVFVAALGKLYTPGGERGVFRTDDGGATWKQVLPGGDWTGAIDLVFDPRDPSVVYAATWERARRPWNFVESGTGSAVWRSADGGDTWKRLGGGLPHGDHVGRIGLAAANDGTLYAAIDDQELLPEDQWDLGGSAVTAKRLRGMTKEDFLAQDPDAIESFIRSNDLQTDLDAKKLIGMVRDDEVSITDLLAELDDANARLLETDIRGLELWRSDDGGDSWRRTHDEPLRRVVNTYGYYFGQVRVAPDDADRVLLLGVPVIASDDGGATFRSIHASDIHVDHHALWVDPKRPDHLILGNDGGVDVSDDGGKTWRGIDAQAVGQFYTVALDDAKPYNIYGGLQDNGTLKGSSRARPELGPSWSRVGGGDGMYVQVDPRDHTTVYFGFQFGFYSRRGAGGRGTVRPRDALGEAALRYNWATPILLSPHNADIVYFGASRLFRSMDKGETWTPISPELARSANRGDVPFGTITTIDESPLELGVVWAGTDDGQVHVTRDGGRTWRDVAAGLPRDRWVSRVLASRLDVDRAYVTLSGYRDDDVTAYVYVTEDGGTTWSSLAAGLPAEAVNVIREDPLEDAILYLGTDRGVYVSHDRGRSWMALPDGLPSVPVHDLQVHRRDRELVAATHGRSIWVLDALPIQELGRLRDVALEVFPLEDVKASRAWSRRPSRWFARPELDPRLHVPFWTSEAGHVELVVRDGGGRDVARRELDAARGVNRFTWDLKLDETLALEAERKRREEEIEKERESGRAPSREGVLAKTPWAEAVRLGRPLYVTPGRYEVVVRRGDEEDSTTLEVKAPKARKPRVTQPKPVRGRRDDD